MRILWFDDNSEFVDQVGRYLRTHDHTVEVCSSWDIALKYCETDTFDIVVVDWQLEEQQTGTDFFLLLERLELQLDASWRLASYHYEEAEQGTKSVPSGSLPVRVKPVPIDAQITSQESFDQLLLEKIAGETDPTDLTAKAYEALSFDGKVDLIEEVYDLYKDKIEAQFSEGAVWVLVCGPKGELVSTARTNSQIMTDDEVWQLALDVGHAPFQFFADEEIDDCATGGDLAGYPTVTLEISGYFDDLPTEIHFDTGAGFSHIDGRGATGAPEPKAPGRRRVKAARMISKLHPSVREVEAQVNCQVTDQTLPVRFRVLVAPDWQEADLARKCTAVGCPAPQQGGLCRYRKGLIGRNLQLESGVSLTLEPAGDDVMLLRTRLSPADSNQPGVIRRLLSRDD